MSTDLKFLQSVPEEDLFESNRIEDPKTKENYQ